MRSSRRWLWFLAIVVVLLLLLPMPIAERYTSSTQDGQYLLHPIRSYRFLWAAALVSPSSKLNTSGKALEQAKKTLEPRLRVSKVQLLFLPDGEPYSYTRKDGVTLSVPKPKTFIWEVWGEVQEPGAEKPGETEKPDVIALLDYDTGAVLAKR
jgi:hypothetical protein